MSTIVSAGGNFYIRAQNGRLRHGFDSLSGASTWSTHMQETDYPARKQEHALSLHYLPSASAPPSR